MRDPREPYGSHDGTVQKSGIVGRAQRTIGGEAAKGSRGAPKTRMRMLQASFWAEEGAFLPGFTRRALRLVCWLLQFTGPPDVLRGARGSVRAIVVSKW
jgi:hypothetical protein